MIEVKELTKRYGTHTAVDRISFDAQPGEIVGLLGPNGAGKTTTMRVLTGFMPPSEGSARVNGYDVLEDSMEVRRHVGYMPEHVPVYPDMTVYGYVLFWARLRGLRRPGRRVDDVLERFGLGDRRKKLVRSLSKGLRQRLGLAQAIVHDPAVVILDEPTIGIDPQQVIEVRDFVRSLRTNHTVLFSSHILSEVEQICDRVVIINEGRVIASGTPQILSQQLKPGKHLFIAVRGSDEKTRQTLSQVPGVQAVHRQDGGYVVRSEEDVREQIANALTQQRLTLLEMRPVTITLEDVFIDLVAKKDGK